MNTNASFLLSEMNKSIRFTNGNVGIGTTNPSQRLQVNGVLSIVTGTDNNLGIHLFTNNADGNTFSTYQGGISSWNAIGLKCNLDNTTRHLFDTRTGDFVALGKIGVGTTSPSYKVDVVGGVRLQGNSNDNGSVLAISNTNAGSNAYVTMVLGNDSGGNFNIFKNSSTRTGDGGIHGATVRNDAGPLSLQSSTGQGTGIFLSTSGNIGISTTTPAYRLDISGSQKINSSTITNGNLILTNSIDGGVIVFSDEHHAIWGRKSVAGVIDKIQIREYGDIEFWTGGFLTSQANRMTITSIGNVGISLTNPMYRFTVSGDDSVASDLAGMIAGVAQSNSNQRIHLGYSTAGDYGWIEAVKVGTNIMPLILQPRGGNLGIGITSPEFLLDVNSPAIAARSGYSGGFHTQWNVSGGQGETNFYNYRGGGGGGFWFKNKNTSNADVGWASINCGWLYPTGMTSSGGIDVAGDSNFSAILNARNNIGYNVTGSRICAIFGGGTVDKNYGATSAFGFKYYSSGDASQHGYMTIAGYRASNYNSPLYSSDGTFADYLTIGGTGNIGVGTNSPGYKLDVNGTFRASGSVSLFGTNHVMGIEDQSSFTRITFDKLRFWDKQWGDIVEFDNAQSTVWTPFRAENTSNTLGALITTGGNVGIGTASPGYKLEVVGTMRLLGNSNDSGSVLAVVNSNAGSNAYSVLVFGNNTGSNLNLWLNSSNRTIDGGVNCATLRNDAGPLRLQSNGSDGIFIGSDTNVGIGTASPVSKLHVSGASSTNGCVLISGRDTYGHSLYVASVDTGKRLAFNHDGTVGNIFAYSYAGSAAQNLQLQGPGGNVGIGTDTPVDKLHVIGSIKTTRSVVDYAGVNHITFNNRIGLALGGAENGGNTGSDFKINTYNDSGGYINTMLTLGRATGNLSIYGAISKGSGSFDIKHPLKSNTNERLVHSFIEGPRCDLIYRGTVQLTNGTATVNLDTDCVESPDCAMSDGTFNALCKNAVKYLHNNDSFDRVRGSINGNILTIVCENKDSTDFIDWVVIAERKDEFIKLWERTNTHGSLITEYTRNA